MPVGRRELHKKTSMGRFGGTPLYTHFTCLRKMQKAKLEAFTPFKKWL